MAGDDSATITLPPPPVPTGPDAMPSSIPRTGKERFLGVIGDLTRPKGQTTDTPLQEHLKDHYQRRFDEAKGYHDQYTQAATMITMANAGQNNPLTGKPFSDDEKREWQNRYQAAEAAYTKAVGVDKQSKQAIQRNTGVMQHIIQTGGKMIQGVAGGGKQGGLPAPPAPGAGAQPAQQAASGQSSAALPPPPPPTSYVASQIADQQKADVAGREEAAKNTADLDAAEAAKEQRKKWAKDIPGLAIGSSEYQEFVLTGKWPTFPKMTPSTYTAPDGHQFTGTAEPTTGKIMDVDTQQIVEGATKTPAASQAAPEVKTDNGGVPYAVKRGGKLITPDSPEFSGDDKRVLDAAMDAYKKGEASKQTRQQVYMDAYAKMRGKVYQYGVIDNDTGALTFANADTINSAPSGKYSPAAQAQTQKNRAAIFDEITYTTGQLESSLKDLGDKSFTPSQRAQIALVLSDKDPKSAFQSFLGSDWAASLDDKQINYITALVSMNESALSLRSIAGMGQGSDMLRTAIGKMLPSAGTPSRPYAERQLQLFKGELGKLRESVPSNISATPGRPPAPPAPTGGGKPAAKSSGSVADEVMAAVNAAKQGK